MSQEVNLRFHIFGIIFSTELMLSQPFSVIKTEVGPMQQPEHKTYLQNE